MGLVAFCREEKLERADFATKRNEDFGVSTFPDHRTKYLRIPAHILTCLLGRAERIQWRGNGDGDSDGESPPRDRESWLRVPS